MAAAPPPPGYCGDWEYDVFLCFRGRDTRHGFTGHLMAALSDKKIKAFIDTVLRKTESIDELLHVLRRSALSIVIFSENFADSSWCLDEVATIAQSMAKFGHRALPVFYKLGWSDVAGDSGRYSAIIDGELKASSEDNKRWKDALKAVANCAGRTSTAIPIESELVKAIVEDVQKQLIDMSPRIKSDNLVGMGSRVLEVEQLLAMDELGETRIIGLWGMGGLGKTTLAKECYDRIVSSTKDIKHCFIRNIDETWERQRGVGGIVRELYSKLLFEIDLDPEDLDMNYWRVRLSRLKVFIVLDDVDTLCQLEQLSLGDVSNLAKLFAAGSRIIVTSRNKKVLHSATASVYGLEGLNDGDSVQLFSLHAFGQQQPPDEYWRRLSHLGTSYCKGTPLALRILGATLFGEDRDYWMSVLSGLSLIQNPKIDDIFRRSYYKLGDDEKRLFLDVAYFLHGMSRSKLIGYMATLYPSSHAKVKDLIDKSLLICISDEDGEKIEVHGLLKESAMNMVNEEPKLSKRSRLVDPDDIHKLLTSTEVKSWSAFVINLFCKGVDMVLPRRKRRKVTDMHQNGKRLLEELRTTEGISLDLRDAKEMYLEANAFESMNSLTCLRFHDAFGTKRIHLPYGGLDSLPDGLRLLHWEGYPSKSLPSRFYPEHLVHLIITHSPITKCWKGFDQPMLVNLMVLNLSHCTKLTAIPDLSKSSKLEELLLQGCKSLVEVPSHVQYLDKLITLDLGHCGNLKRVPTKLNSKVLKYVLMEYCPNVEQCLEINSGELVYLNLDGTPVRELPRAIYRLKLGGNLCLFGKNITNFPAISGSLQIFCLSHTAVEEMESYDDHQASSQLLPKFARLELKGNSQLKSLSKHIWYMVSSSLKILDSPLLESLPEISEPMNGLFRISINRCESFKSLPSSINNLASLDFLCLRNTRITSLPSSIQELGHLRSIDLSNCKSLEYIPSSIHKLPKLYTLNLSGCGSIPSLPELPPSLRNLDVSGCKSLQALPSNASKLSWNRLMFFNCPQLDRMLPDEIVANYHAQSLSFKGHYEFALQYSESEIPEWFVYKSMKDKDDSCLTVQLPPANCTMNGEQLIKGIIFGVVWSSNAFRPWPGAELKCDCNIGTITVASWRSGFWDCPNSTDQVLLWFDPKSSGETEGRGGKQEPWYVKYAARTVSFRFYSSSRYRGVPKDVKIKRCGVSLVY